MKLALAFVVVAACARSSKSPDSPATTESASTSTTPTTTASSATATSESAPTSGSTVAAATTRSARPQYSCFAYSQRGSTVKRNACMRTEECDPYLEQARQVGGIVADGGCASVDVLFCFHQSATKADPQGLDVCQPSLDACKSERALLVKNGSSVDTDCAQR